MRMGEVGGGNDWMYLNPSLFSLETASPQSSRILSPPLSTSQALPSFPPVQTAQ